MLLCFNALMLFMFLDFHTHTLASDGQLTPAELVKKAKKLGILYLAKTDHDTVDLMPAFMAAGKKYGVHTIPGMEISSRYTGRHLHLVALNIDYLHPAIKKYTAKVLAVRRNRALKMARNLAALGWHIKWSELKRQLIARPHIALAVIKHLSNRSRLIKEFGHLPNFSEFIKRYIIEGKPNYVKRDYYISPTAAIRMVHRAGGLIFVAHPASRGEEFCYPQTHLTKLAQLGFDGLEVYAREHTPADIKFLSALTNKYALLTTGGSDYHGDNDKTRPLGVCHHDRRLTVSHCQPLVDRLRLGY